MKIFEFRSSHRQPWPASASFVTDIDQQLWLPHLGEPAKDVVGLPAQLLPHSLRGAWDEEAEDILGRLAEVRRRSSDPQQGRSGRQADSLLALTQELPTKSQIRGDLHDLGADRRRRRRSEVAGLPSACRRVRGFIRADQMSDAPLRQLAAEITREKLFERLHQELPYHSTVETESLEGIAWRR